MTRRTKREFKQALEKLAADAAEIAEESDTPPGTGPPIIRWDGDEYVTRDGDPVPTTDAGDLDPPGDGPVIVLDERYAPVVFDGAGDT